MLIKRIDMYEPKNWEELIKYINLNHKIDEIKLNELKPFISYRNLKKGEKLYEEGKLCKSVFCVKSGIIRNYMSYDDKTRTRWFATEGDFFTSMYSFTSGNPSPSTAEAVIKSEIWEIPISKAKELFEKDNEWARWLMKMLSEGIGIWEYRDKILLSDDSYDRFKKIIDIIPLQIMQKIPLQHIASYLGFTPQTLSLFRKRWIDETIRK